MVYFSHRKHTLKIAPQHSMYSFTLFQRHSFAGCQFKYQPIHQHNYWWFCVAFGHCEFSHWYRTCEKWSMNCAEVLRKFCWYRLCSFCSCSSLPAMVFNCMVDGKWMKKNNPKRIPFNNLKIFIFLSDLLVAMTLPYRIDRIVLVYSWDACLWQKWN